MSVDYVNKATGTDRDYYMMVIDANGLIHFANSYLISNFGFQAEKFLKKHNFFAILDENYLSAFKNVLTEVRTTEKKGEIELAARNGSLHWIKWEIERCPGDLNNKFFCVGYDIVEKGKVKKLKKIAKDHYGSIMEGLNVGVLLQDANGDVLTVNKRIAEIFETSIESFYDTIEFKNLWKTAKIANKSISFEENPSLTALRTGVAQSNIEISFVTVNGTAKNILVSSEPLFEEGQHDPVTAVTSFVDISKEYEFKKEAEFKDNLFNTFNNYAPSLAWMVDEDAKLYYANKSFFDYLQISKEVIGKNILNFIPDFLAKTLEHKHRKVIATGLPLHTEEKVFLANGSELIFWISLFPVETSGTKRMVGGEALNITERYNTEQKLKQVNERLKYLSHVTTDAIWEWNMQTGYIYRNQVLKDIIGSSGNNTSNLSWWFRRIHPDDRRKLRNTIKDVIDTQGPNWESEYRFKTSSGEYINVFDRGYIIYETGLPVKMIGSLHDVTKLKELETKLVEGRIKHQKDITETIFNVQEKERTRIGHELHDNVNQLLGTSKMFLDIMKPAGDEDAELKKKITEYILLAVEEIRRLSKEMVTPQLREKGLIESVKTIVEDLQATQPFDVSFDYDDSVEVLSSGKKVTFFRIVQEQVKNTIKYSRANHLNISLHLSAGNVVLEIKDDGVGFDSSQTRRGIGLSNIYERTHFYEGKVIIDSSPGCGCKITVTIPADN